MAIWRWFVGLFRPRDPIGDAMRDYANRMSNHRKIIQALAEYDWDV